MNNKDLQRIGYISLLVSSSFASMIISYFVDTISFLSNFRLIYGKEFSPFLTIKITLLFITVYIVVESIIWFFKEAKIILDPKWVGWSLIIQNLSWLLVPLGDIGARFLLAVHNILMGPLTIYFITSAIIYECIKIINPKFDPKKSIIFPEVDKPFKAIISSFIALSAKELLFYIL